MIISFIDKFIFIHIPKVAGTSLNDAIINASGYNSDLVCDIKPDKLSVFCNPDPSNSNDLHQHAKYIDVKIYLDNKNLSIKDFFVFCFIRNPWEWYISTYLYNIKIYKIIRDEYSEELYWWAKECYDHSFNDWLKISYDRKYTQFSYIEYEGGYPVNFIGNLNDIQNSFNILCDQIQLPKTKIKHLNANPHNHYTKYYSNTSADLVQKLAEKEIDYHKYIFSIKS